MNDYYKLLQVERTASQDVIKKSYRKLVKKFHPDANPGNAKAEEVFKQINEAYATLSDEGKKAEYDRRMFGGADGSDANAGTSSNNGPNAAYRTRDNMSAADFAGASGAFEGFFGFNPNSSSPELKKKNDKVKPMKTKDAFDAIFGKKRF